VKDKASKITEIRSFLGGQYSQNHALITSRPVGNPGQYFQVEDFPRYQIQPLHKGSIHYYIRLWYKNSGLEKAEADQHEANLQKVLSDNERVSLLAQNPLLLTIILLIHRDQAQLKERCDLYHCAINTLLHSWEKAKSSTSHRILTYLHSDDLRWLMSRLAYRMHTEGAADGQASELLIGRNKLIRQLSEYIQHEKHIRADQAKQEAERFLDQVVSDRAGLLCNQGDGCYAFVHRTFQEYLAAEYLCSHVSEEDGFEPLLYEILHKAHWREVILLLVAQLSEKKAAQLVRAILQKNSEYERWLYRDLLFAGCCLAEKPEGLGQGEENLTMVTDILTRLVQLKVSDRLHTGSKVKQQIHDIFLSLSGTSFEQEALEILNSYAAKISSNEMLTYRLALANQEEYIDELLSLIKEEKTSGEAVKIIEKVSKHRNASVFLIQRLWSVFRSELPIARALWQLGCRDEWLSHVLEYDGYDEYLQDKMHAEFITEDLKSIHAQIDPLLEKLRNGSASVIDDLIDWLFYDEYNISDYVAQELGKVSKFSQVIESKLLEKLPGNLDWERGGIVQALGYLNNLSDDALQALVKLLHDDEDVFVRAKAAKALSNLDISHDFILTELISSLKETCYLHALTNRTWSFPGDPDLENNYYNREVFESLVQFSKVYSPVSVRLEHWIEQHHDWECFEDAVDALWRILEE
jgi:hypothetical protein